MEIAKSFFDKLPEDKDLQLAIMAAVQTAVTKEEKLAAITTIANEAGFAVSADELQKVAESIQASTAKLTDEDLEKVADGYYGRPSDDSIVTGVIVRVVVGAIIADAIINDK